MGLYHWLVGSVIDEGDEFGQRLRKSVIGVLFFPFSFMLIYYMLQMVFFPGLASGISRWMPFCVQGTLASVYWVQFFYLRKHRHVGDLQAAAVPWATALLLQGLVWYVPDADMKPLWLSLAMMAVLLQIPKVYLYLAFTLVLILIQDWNTVHLEEPEQLLVPDSYYRSSPLNRFIYTCLLSSILGAVIHNFIHQVAESERRGAALKAANAMTLDILKYQRKYETEAISDVLKKCKEDGVVEAELIGLYEAMNVNLKSYRPFLPNYLFQDTEDDEEQDEAHGPVPRASSAKDLQSKMSHSKSFVDSESGSVRNGSGKQTSSTGRDHRSSLRRSTQMATTNLNRRGHLFEGRITFALVDINTDRLSAGSDAQTSSSASILRTITHMVYSLAKETKASVHSMLGDTVQLTWNATSSVALAETKGAVFFARLAKMLGPDADEPTLNINAAVCSGKATVHNITTDNQQALIIAAPWLPALEGCFALAKQVGAATTNGTGAGGCILMDDRTMKGSVLEVQSCPVEQVSYAENGKSSFLGSYEHAPSTDAFGAGAPPHGNEVKVTTMVHQVLAEHLRADDEWMYQLEGTGQEDDVSITAALRLKAMARIVENNYSDCRATLVELREALLATSPAPAATANGDKKKGGGGGGGGGGARATVENPEFLRALESTCRRGLGI